MVLHRHIEIVLWICAFVPQFIRPKFFWKFFSSIFIRCDDAKRDSQSVEPGKLYNLSILSQAKWMMKARGIQHKFRTQIRTNLNKSMDYMTIQIVIESLLIPSIRVNPDSFVSSPFPNTEAQPFTVLVTFYWNVIYVNANSGLNIGIQCKFCSISTNTSKFDSPRMEFTIRWSNYQLLNSVQNSGHTNSLVQLRFLWQIYELMMCQYELSWSSWC